SCLPTVPHVKDELLVGTGRYAVLLEAFDADLHDFANDNQPRLPVHCGQSYFAVNQTLTYLQQIGAQVNVEDVEARVERDHAARPANGLEKVVQGDGL